MRPTPNAHAPGWRRSQVQHGHDDGAAATPDDWRHEATGNARCGLRRGSRPTTWPTRPPTSAPAGIENAPQLMKHAVQNRPVSLYFRIDTHIL